MLSKRQKIRRDKQNKIKEKINKIEKLKQLIESNVKVNDILKEIGISKQTYYNMKKKIEDNEKTNH